MTARYPLVRVLAIAFAVALGACGSPPADPGQAASIAPAPPTGVVPPTTDLCICNSVCNTYGNICSGGNVWASNPTACNNCNCVTAGTVPVQTCAPYACNGLGVGSACVNKGDAACYTSCAAHGDADCATGYYCCDAVSQGASGCPTANNTCVAQVPPGQVCKLSSGCQSPGLCLGNVCCATSCVTGGTCAATSCALSTGACNYNNGTTCASATCGFDLMSCQYHSVGPTETCSNGACPSQTTTECVSAGGGQYMCTGGACLTSCSSDSQCDNAPPCNNFCDLTAGSATYQQCVHRKADGQACGSNDACMNGHCVSGICCHTACTSTSGTCGGSCSTGTCSYPSGNACSCTVGATSASELTCDGAGNCSTGPTTCGNATNLYTCMNSTACNTGCSYKADGSGDAACFAGYYCNPSNVCVLKQPAGATCSAPDQCGSNVCYGNACCSGACETTTSCSGANCMCASSGCNVTGGCGYPSGTTCHNQTCSGGVETLASTCDGNGTCKAPTPATQSCGLYNCNTSATACLTSCQSNGDCSTNFCCLTAVVGTAGCTSGMVNTCMGKLGDGQSCSQNSDCTSNACSQGVCCNRACAGGCTEACNLPGADKGTCTAIANSTDPLGTCNQGSSTCAGTCEGGACAYPGTTTSCGPACAACNGAGACSAAMPGCFADAGVPDARIVRPDMSVTFNDSGVRPDASVTPAEAGPTIDATTSVDAAADASASQREAGLVVDARPDLTLRDGGSTLKTDGGFGKQPSGTPPAGCGCSVGSASQTPTGAMVLALLGLAAAGALTRRRRSR
jgi:MYXO-CTERM domain-containing protein